MSMSKRLQPENKSKFIMDTKKQEDSQGEPCYFANIWLVIFSEPVFLFCTHSSSLKSNN